MYVAALTEKMSELVGEVADGVMPYLAPPAYMKKLANAVHRGAEKAGRSPSQIDITNGIPSFISDDLEAARQAARRGYCSEDKLGGESRRSLY